MILALALSTLVLSAQPDPEPRIAAARTLRAALEVSAGTRELAPWIAAARGAIEVLGPGDFSASLDVALIAARSIAAMDVDGAARSLEKELRTAVLDLEFTPVREAELPVGFPAPTPVREIEIKRYPKYRLARTDMRADVSGIGSTSAFWRLFTHIQSHDIPMTAPVETTYAQRGEGWNETEMAFLYASPDVGAEGRSGNVDVVDVEAAWALSIGCRGRMNTASLDAARDRLLDWIAGQHDFEPAGAPRSMGYNSPMISASRQFFEVQIPMRWKAENAQQKILIDFGIEDAAASWAPIDDGVMGGLSGSELRPSGQGTCVFAGQVSLENNGGFASVRTRPTALGLDGAQAVRLVFRGDGKTYKLRLGTGDAFDGVNYELPFATENGVWGSRTFALSDFVPVWRGRRVSTAGPLVAANVRTVGLMISDKQVGAFQLELAALLRD